MKTTTFPMDRQHEATRALYFQVVALTDLLNDWDLALAEYDARSILDELAAQQAEDSTPVSEPWWARFIPLAGVVGLVVTFGTGAALAAMS